jgi:triosephosphate isomerase (TIM)
MLTAQQKLSLPFTGGKGYIIVNYKTYDQGRGQNGRELTKVLAKVNEEYGVNLAVAVSPMDMRDYADSTGVPIFAQHMDPIGYGSNTGYLLPELVKEVGAVGTLINHSEHRLKLADIEALIRKCDELGLLSCVCTNNILTTKAAACLEPDFVAVEPPELIGGDISVSTAQPEIVSGSVEAVSAVAPNVQTLCGAGVKNGNDVKIALELGSVGVLLASGVVKPRDPGPVMHDLAQGIIRFEEEQL